ncbi:hypothetical protein DL93DRAFT_1052976 [Clavulina sp. PMI_390]|nr:hypothetical protein DL93DRAFT_1052976 [Clavulina sp. PMI_390]
MSWNWFPVCLSTAQSVKPEQWSLARLNFREEIIHPVIVENPMYFINIIRKYPLPPSPVRGISSSGTDYSTESHSSKSRIESLPGELIANIFDECGLSEAICLGLTSTQMWARGERQINKLYLKFHAPWLDQPIICLHTQAPKLPTSALALPLVEEAILRSGGNNEDVQDASFAQNLVQEVLSTCKGHQIDQARPDLDYKSFSKFELQYHTAYMYRLFNHKQGADAHLQKGPLLLRNLSKRIYVRSDTLAVRSGGDAAVSLCRALFCRITWGCSADLRSWLRFGLVKHPNGPWAGDCFDVVALGACGGDWDSSSLEGWSDETEAVKEDLIGIWEGYYNDSWAEKAW